MWEDTVRPQDLRALDPGPPPRLHATPDVLVVGGGIVGLACALFAVRAGLGRVAVVERGRLAGEASGRAAGGLSPDTHALARPGEFLALARAGLAAHRELDREWEGEAGVRTLDWLVALPQPPPGALARAAGAEALDAAGARAAEPQLGEVGGALLFRDQAHVHPLRLAAAFARRAGALATGVEVLGADRRGERVVRVRTSHGDLFPGAVVFATGSLDPAWAPTDPALCRPPVKGHLLATGPAPFRLQTGVASSVLVVQLPDGRLVAGGTFDEGDREPVVREEVVGGVLAELHRLLPASRGLPVTHRWCCFRPRVADELPVVDRVPGTRNAWVTAGHHRTGLLLAPAVGRALASWIATGRRPGEVAAFGLDRPALSAAP